MNITEFTKDIYYVGVNDRTTKLFESLWSLPNGVSYNSYIIKGEKIALIDTVHVAQSLKFISQVKDIIGDAKIDYLIINHMEPDHSGAIRIIKEFYPEIKIIGNSHTQSMIKGFYNISENVMTIADGDIIDLGNNKTLKFIFTPMIHWPETMMTYETHSGSLFTGDAFGCYGALNGGIIDKEMDTDIYFNEIYRYYSNIVMKYSPMVQKALQKTEGLTINNICPTHGPVWHKHIQKVLKIYSDLCHYISEDGVVIAYGSMYGNTEELVEIIARQLSQSGIKNIKIYNMATCDMSMAISDICRYKGLIIGCPTYSNDIFPPIKTLLSAIKIRGLKNKVFASFGSYTWAPGMTKKISEYFENTNFKFINGTFEMKQAADKNDIASAIKLAQDFATIMKE